MQGFNTSIVLRHEKLATLLNLLLGICIKHVKLDKCFLQHDNMNYNQILKMTLKNQQRAEILLSYAMNKIILHYKCISTT